MGRLIRNGHIIRAIDLHESTGGGQLPRAAGGIAFKVDDHRFLLIVAGRLAVEMLARRMHDQSVPPEVVKFAPLGITSRLSTRRLAVVGKRVADALDLIRREACSGLKAADVVKAMGVTERLAETRFKRAVGHKITEEISAVRLERALELLRDPNQGIGPIANMCGWDTEAYMKRLFKKKFGMTMREWRAANAGRRG